MVSYEQDNQRWVVIPAEGIYQPFNPDTRLPFKSEQDAMDWEQAWLTLQAAGKARIEADLANLPPQPPQPKRKILSRFEFRSLFSMSELVAITTASKEDVNIEVFMDSMKIAEEVDLTYPDVTAGLSYLVTHNFITQDKMNNILQGV
jgi:hypothetical protein